MTRKKLMVYRIICLISLGLVVGPAFAKKPSLDAWKPKFDPKGAKYKFIVSNVSHPVIKGVYAGFAIRDELWKRTNGQMYLDFKPFSMLGGEVEVLNQLQMGAIQGMGVSSVAATNLGPRFGVVNLPFLINSFDKLDKFAYNLVCPRQCNCANDDTRGASRHCNTDHVARSRDQAVRELGKP